MSTTWLVTGASGLLGRASTATLVRAGHHVVAVRHERSVDIDGADEIVADLTDPAAASHVVDAVRPTWVLHAAGLTNVDTCEAEPDLARRVHVDASASIAAAAANTGAGLVHISTDHLWDGTRSFVDEREPTSPLNVYASTKRHAEIAVLDAHPGALVVRTNFFGVGPAWRRSLSDWVLGELDAGRTVHAFDDVWFTPIHVRLLHDVIVRLADAGATGVVHVAGSERVSKHDFAVRLAARFGRDVSKIARASVRDAKLFAPRPNDMSLGTNRAADLLGAALPDLDASLESLADETCRQPG